MPEPIKREGCTFVCEVPGEVDAMWAVDGVLYLSMAERTWCEREGRLVMVCEMAEA